jgi:hypothetical protein
MVLSPVERLLRDVENQEAAHERLVHAYDELACCSRDPGLRLFAGVLRAEVERDRALLARAAASLRKSIFWLDRPEPLPEVACLPSQRARVLSLLDRLQRLNRERSEGLRDFRTAAHHIYDGLLEQVADFAVSDATKHAQLLTYMTDRIRRTEAPAPVRGDDGGHLRRIFEEVVLEKALAPAV